MERILVMGCSGCGKTTFALELGQILNYPVIHLDRHYWQPGWEPLDKHNWEKRIRELTAGEKWICDGNYHETLDLRLEKADTLIYLDSNVIKCFMNVVRRYLQFKGKTRPDLNRDCPEQIDLDFLKWIWNFNRKIKPQVFNILRNAEHDLNKIIIRSKKERINFLKIVTSNDNRRTEEAKRVK